MIRKRDAEPDAILQALSDRAADSEYCDYLNFARYADALAFLIDQKSMATPLVIAISAPWGAGKTTLANLVEEQLQEKVAWDEAHIICKFNAWKHDDAPNLGAAFAAEVAQRANGYRHWWRRLIKPLPSPMLSPQQRWRRRLAIIAASLVVATTVVLTQHMGGVVAAVMSPESQKWTKAIKEEVPGFASTFIAIFVIAFLAPKIYSGMRSLARFVDDPGAEAARGSIHLVRKELKRLIHSATRGRRRFVIFVDDLERCRPPRAVEVCEVASQLLDHEDVITVLVADMETIARSAAIKYHDLEFRDQGQLETGAYDRYGRAYLQKLVQIQFDLPPTASDQLRDMLLLAAQPQLTDRKWYGAAYARIRKALTSPAARYVAGAISIAAFLVFEYGFVTNPYNFKALYNLKARSFSLFLLPLAVFLAAYSVMIMDVMARSRARRARKSVDEAIEKLPLEMSIDAMVSEVSKSETKVSNSYIRRRIFNQWLKSLKKDNIVDRIDSLVFEFLPGMPRASKRLLNQVRLMMVVAISREFFSVKDKAEDSIQPERLGKWLILNERWPSVADFFSRNQGAVRKFERTRNLPPLLRSYHISDFDDISDLKRLLNSHPPFGDIKELALLGGTRPNAQRSVL